MEDREEIAKVMYYQHVTSGFLWENEDKWFKEKYLAYADQILKGLGYHKPGRLLSDEEKKIAVVGKTLMGLLVHLGVVREDAAPTYPELIMAAEEYIKAGYRKPGMSDEEIRELYKKWENSPANSVPNFDVYLEQAQLDQRGE